MSIKLIIGNEEVKLKLWSFPGGERGIRIEEPEAVSVADFVRIICQFRSSDDIFDVLNLVNALRNINKDVGISLDMPYFPYARQDRLMTEGESFSLQVMADIINMCNFTMVTVMDPHSDVLAGLFRPGSLYIIRQHDLMAGLVTPYGIRPEGKFALISPDAGASKKIYPLAKIVDCPVIVANKTRNVSTGDITGVSIPLEEIEGYDTLFIVDDICDGGRTFVELGLKIRQVFKGKLVLLVTHGIFSKGMDVFNGIIDEVHSVNDMREGK